MKLIQKYISASQTVKASLWFVGCTVIQKGLSFIIVPLFTNAMSEIAYGQYVLYQSWLAAIQVFATLNIHYQVYNNGAIRFENRTNEYVSSLIGLSWVAAIVVFSFLCLFSWMWTPLTGMPRRYLLYMFFESAFSMPYNLFLCRERMRNNYRTAVAMTLLYVFASSLLGLIFVYRTGGMSEARIQAEVIVTGVIGLGILSYLLRISYCLFNLEIWKYVLSLALPMVSHYLASILFINSDRIMIAHYCGEFETAIYSVAASMGTIMQTVINSSNAAINPWIYRSLASSDYRKLRKGIDSMFLIMAIASFIPTLFGIIYIKLFMKASYLKATPLISIIAMGSYFTYTQSIFLVINLYFEKTRYISYSTITATSANIVMNYFGIRLFGYHAAAYTSSLSHIFLASLHYFMLRKTAKEVNIPIGGLLNLKRVVILGIIVIAGSLALSILI